MKANRKFKKPDASSKARLILKEIIGLTTKNGNGLASSVSSSRCAYVAGCVVVVYNVDSSTQSHLMVTHRTPRPLTCLAMSADGRFVAAGESGHQPAVLVWDCTTLSFLCELKGHLYGVECIAFSPDGEHLVSIGGYIYLWDWRNGMLVTKLKASSSCSAVTSVSFSSNAKFIVTAGKNHLKFWTFGTSPRTKTNKRTVSMGLHGKHVDLGPQKGSSFVSVTSAIWTYNSVMGCGQRGPFHIYALTDAGVLCLIDYGLSVRNSVDLKVKRGYSLSASSKFIACACSDGVVQLFTVENLKYVGSLLHSAAKNCQEESDLHCPKASEKSFQRLPTLPDAIACQFSTSEKLVVVYGDHSLSIWDIHDISKATRCCALISHSACIWDIKNLCCENMHDPSFACAARGCSGGVSFATCSADGTIRLWDLLLQPDSSEGIMDCNSLITEPLGSICLVSAGTFERDTIEANFSNVGFRSLAVSSDGKYMAAGDCEGNLHIYDLHNADYACLKDAHDAEILSLSFSFTSKKCADFEESNNHYLLVSGGRDRAIHLFDVKRNFDLIESIDDHSAAVTSVKLAYNGCKILSCSADRSLVFRDVSVMDSGYMILRRHHQMASNGTVYDMSMDPEMEVVVTVGQDKKINTFDIASGKLIRSFKQDKDFGDPIKVTVDPSCSYLVCSYSNKSICIHDFVNGEIVAQALGHGEVVTGVIFLPDCRHMVSVGGDGCIFVWELPGRLASRMLHKVKENSFPLSPRNFTQPVCFSGIVLREEKDQSSKTNPKNVTSVEKQQADHQGGDSQETTAFKFTISRLPKWARAKITSPDFAPRNLEFTLSQKHVELEISSPFIGEEGRVSASVSPEDQTPSNHVSVCKKVGLNRFCGSSPETDNSQVSASPHERISSFAMDNRWLTVYNVCLDLLNSPEVQNLEDVKKPVSSLNLSQDQVGQPSDGEPSFEHEDHAIDDKRDATKDAYPRNIDPLQSIQYQQEIEKTNVCSEAVTDATEQLHSNKTKVEGKMDVDVFQINSECSNLFKEHFGSLSTKLKVEKKKSSARRRFSSQYFVQRDYIGSCKRLFDINSGMLLNYKSESAINNTTDGPAFQVLEEQLVIGSNEKDPNLAECLLDPLPAFSGDKTEKCAVEENSSNVELKDGTIQEESVPGGNELEDKITACREALVNLETAADSVLQLFSDLGTVASAEELTSGPGAQLCDQVAKLIPPIAEKLSAVTKLVQLSKKD
ncbi:hypothetical protein SLA2020_118820 [Shorea laevis]